MSTMTAIEIGILSLSKTIKKMQFPTNAVVQRCYPELEYLEERLVLSPPLGGGGFSGPGTFSTSEVLTAGAAINIQANQGTSFTAPVANFTDSIATQTSGDFAGTINWGDGSQSAGSITQNPDGSFEVSGTHTYSASGLDYVQSTISVTNPANLPMTGRSNPPANLVVTNPATVAPAALQPDPGNASSSYTPQGLLDLIYVDHNHNLFEDINGKINFYGGNVLSASIGYGPMGRVLDVVYTTGVLVQFDATGIHNLGGNYTSVSITFDATGQLVRDLVDQNHNLIQIDSSGIHTINAGNIQTVNVANINGQLVYDISFTNNQAYQLSSAGILFIGSNISAFSTTFNGTDQTIFVSYENGDKQLNTVMI